MSINPSDGYYKAEQTSPQILAMRSQLCSAYGVALSNFGAKGNLDHDNGYHRSRSWVLRSPDSQYGTRDYSVTLPADVGNPDDVAAFDFTPGVWGSTDNRNKMIVITRRVIEAMQSHDPRVANLREFAGTLDGKAVVTYDQSRNAFKTPFDSSHLYHGHGSIYRTRTRWSQQGIVDVMLGRPAAPPRHLLEERTMQIVTVKNPPAGQTSINGKTLVPYSRGYLTPNGFWGLDDDNYGKFHNDTDYWNHSPEFTWDEIQALCAALRQPLTLGADQTATIADSARDGAREGLNGARIVVDPE
jgi:hypothetical protein